LKKRVFVNEVKAHTNQMGGWCIVARVCKEKGGLCQKGCVRKTGKIGLGRDVRNIRQGSPPMEANSPSSG